MIKRDMFPKVYFSKIELDWKGNPLRKDNPYVKDDETRVKTRKLAGPRKWEQKRTSLKVIEPDDELNIILEVQLEVPRKKDRLLNNFFDREFYEKYLKIKIIQVNNRKDLDSLLKAFGDVPINEIDKLVSSSDLSGKNVSMKSFDLTLDDREEVERNIIRLNFFNKDRDPEYLSYVAFSFLDIEAIENDFSELDATSELFYGSSDIFIETVFNQGAVVSESFLFFDSNGNLFNGAVEFDGENYYKFGTQEKLRAQTVENNTVIDFRSLRQFEKIADDFTEVLNNFDILYHDKSDANTPIIQTPKQYFSECYTSPDPQGRCRLAFALNQRNVLKYESAFPWLLTRASEAKVQDILSRSLITNMRVYRQRIEKNSTDDYRIFGEGKLELVADISEKSYKNFGDKETNIDLDLDGVKETLASLGREVNVAQTGIRMLTFVDDYMQKINQGHYNYVISLTMRDGTVSYLSDKLSQMRQTVNRFETYRESLVNSREYDYLLQRFRTSFIAKLKETYKGAEYVPWIDIPLDFIEILDSIKRVDNLELFTVIKASLSPDTVTVESLDLVGSFLNRIVYGLEEQLRTVGGFLSNTSKDYPRKDQIRRSNKLSTTDIEITRNIGGEFNSEDPVVFGIDFLEFLNQDGNATSFVNSDGLNTIDGRDFEIRVDNENSKYFSSTGDAAITTKRKTYNNGDSIDNNSFTYFTPSMVQVNGESNYLTQNVWNDDYVTGLESDLQQNSEGILKAGVGVDDNNAGELGFTSLGSLSSFVVNDDGDASSQSEPVDTFTSAKSLTSDGIENTNKKTSDEPKAPESFLKEMYSSQKEAGEITTSEKGKFLRKRSKKSTFFDVKSSQNVIDKNSYSEQKVTELPNQIKSLFMASSGNPTVNVNSVVDSNGAIKPISFQNAGVFRFNYELIGKVEYLSEYNVSNNEDILTKSPNWVPLKKEDYDNFVGREILCRIRKYDVEFLPGKKLDQKNLPIYNSYFILRPSDKFTQEQQESDFTTVEQAKEDFKKEISQRETYSPKYTNTGVFIK